MTAQTQRTAAMNPVNLHFLMMHLRSEMLAEAQAFEREFPGEMFPFARASMALERGKEAALAAWADRERPAPLPVAPHAATEHLTTKEAAA